MSTQADESARERIRNSLDESLIVEAAAGAGKTTELVAVTFTRKAAGELRLRLRIELDAARIASPSRHLEDALARLEEARIGTIHSFCAELLRHRPVEAQIPPRFEDLDENHSQRLYTRAFNAWIQTALADMPDGIRRALSRVTDSESPLDQIRNAGWSLVEWRDFPRSWRRGDFDQRAEIDHLIPHTSKGCGAATAKVTAHSLRLPRRIG